MTESIIYMTHGVHCCINYNLYITKSACRSRLWNVSRDLEYMFVCYLFLFDGQTVKSTPVRPSRRSCFLTIGSPMIRQSNSLCHLGNEEIDEFFPFSMQTAAHYINFFSWGSMRVVHPFLCLNYKKCRSRWLVKGYIITYTCYVYCTV